MDSNGAMQPKIQSRLLIPTRLGPTNSSPSPVPSRRYYGQSNHALSISEARPFQISPRNRLLTSLSFLAMSRFGLNWSPRLRVLVTSTGPRIRAQIECSSSKACRLLVVVVRITSTFAHQRTLRSWASAIGFAGIQPMLLDMRRSNANLPNASIPTVRLTLRRRASLFSRFSRKLKRAAEGCRSPRRFARHEAHETTPRVLECSSPLELSHANPHLPMSK